MNNPNDILPLSLIIVGLSGFIIACFWTIYYLEKDNKKQKKHKKA
jgi:hypothetical protein